MQRGPSNAGVTLIEILLGCGIVAVVAAGLGSFVVNVTTQYRALALADARVSIAERLQTLVDCEKTLDNYMTAGNPPSRAGANINLRDRNDDVIVNSTGRTFGPWCVRALCTHDRIRLSLARPKGPGGLKCDAASTVPGWPHFFKDPMSETALSWNHPQAQPDGGVGMCNGWFTQAQAKLTQGMINTPVDPAGTWRPSAAYPQTEFFQTVLTSFVPTSATCSADAQAYTWSALSCSCNPQDAQVLSDRVIFKVRFSHDDHAHNTSCPVQYFISGE